MQRCQPGVLRARQPRLDALRQENSAKLDEMRQTVDEKLHATLETRLGESFNRVVHATSRSGAQAPPTLFRSRGAAYRTLGEAVWGRFTGGREGTLWYYRALVDAYRATDTVPALVDELDRVVTKIERLAARG